MTANEQQLMNAYIPPPGALQFEFDEKDIPPSATRIPHLREKGYIWVKPPTPSAGEVCDCTKTYPVIIESLHPEAAAAIRAMQAKSGAIPSVCAHIGKVIE